MPFSAFKKVLDRWHLDILEHKKTITIGGGEPTTHPDFWNILDYTMTYGRPVLATNGKKTKDALLLEAMARKGKIGVTLSLDEWHEPIDDKVIRAFKKGMVYFKSLKSWDTIYGKKPDKRAIRIVTRPVNRGKWKWHTKKDETTGCCRVPRVKPDGVIKLCSCMEAPVMGTVEDGIYEQFKQVPLSGGQGHRFCYKEYRIDEHGSYIPPLNDISSVTSHKEDSIFDMV